MLQNCESIHKQGIFKEPEIQKNQSPFSQDVTLRTGEPCHDAPSGLS
jgi:hypothetical protein